MLDPDDTILIVVDVQGKLAQLMHEKETLFANLRKLISGAKALGLPILWAEQVPEKMGPTVPEVAELLTGLKPIAKSAFSCWGDARFREAAAALKRKQVLIAGIETHVCVYQTAQDLAAEGFAVQVVADAVSSRAAENKALGLERIRFASASLTSVEMCLMELLRTAEHPAFREILKVIR
jgi:nicotinamidase-related amidase